MTTLLHKTKQNLASAGVLAGIVGAVAYISVTSTWTPAHVGFVVAGIVAFAALMLALNSNTLDKPLNYLLIAGSVAYLGYETIAHEWISFTSTSVYSITIDVLIAACIIALLGSTLRKFRNRHDA